MRRRMSYGGFFMPKPRRNAEQQNQIKNIKGE